jgi:hypothetical protein
VTIEATDSAGELAGWFDDYWWTDLIERWGDEAVTLHIAPTQGALLHPIVLHQMEMVSRVAARWRMVGHAYRSDVASDEVVELLASSPYHEVRFIDQPRPEGSLRGGHGTQELGVDEVFARVRREQISIGASRPVLVRLPRGTDLPKADAVAEAHIAGSV